MENIWSVIIGDYSYLIAITALFVCFIIRIPISVSMLTASTIYILAAGLDMGTILSRVMSRLLNTYTVMAVPLFILTANILNSSKVADYLFNFSKVMIGKRKGALAHVNVLISLVFAGMSGSAFADASGIGKIELEAMQADGYPDEFSCALTACTATIGPIFPPSLNLVNYAMITGASCGALLLGGVVPALLMVMVLMLYVAYTANKRDFPPGLVYTKKEFFRFTKKALPALLTPGILLVGIYSGIVTPTEASAISACWALLVSVCFYRTLSLKGIWKCFKQTAIQCGPILLIIAASGPFNYCITVSGLGDIITNAFMNITTNPYVFLSLINVLFLVLGMFLDSSTITWVILPLIYPIAQALGIDMVHFGIVFTMNILIGMCTPPFGMLVFLSAQLTNSPVKKVFKEAFPMVGSLIAVLILVTYIPGLVTWLGTAA